MLGFEPIEYDEPRQLRKKLPITEPTLKGVIWIVLLVLIFLGPKIGWGNLFVALIFVGGIKLVDLVWRERDYIRSAWPLFFGNYAAREAAAEKKTPILITEEEIDDVEAIMQFAEDETDGEASEPPPVSKWQWLSATLVFVLMLWPVYFWPRYFWQYLGQYPSEDATDRAEDWMWLGFFIAIPSLTFIGWGSEGSTIPFYVVLISYAVSGLVLWAILTYRRNTAS